MRKCLYDPVTKNGPNLDVRISIPHGKSDFFLVFCWNNINLFCNETCVSVVRLLWPFVIVWRGMESK